MNKTSKLGKKTSILRTKLQNWEQNFKIENKASKVGTILLKMEKKKYNWKQNLKLGSILFRNFCS